MATVDHPADAKRKYKVIGTRPIRHDGTDKVTGRAKYGADIQLTGMLYGAILRSPHAHARIKSIDASKALALPGVRAVVTNADLPDVASRVAELGEGAVNIAHLRCNVLAEKKVLYKGHAVAGVAADTVHIAEEAARLIEVEYEPLPPVLDVRRAMQTDAPILLEDLRTESLAGDTNDQPTNIAKHLRFEKGNVAEGFAKAKVVIEREFHTATVHQGYIEPHTATVLWNADGHITVWTSTQGTFMVRQQMADLLGLPASHIKVIPMEIGGGFGGKISVYLKPVAALLSKKTGRPVKMVMDRASVFEATGPTPGSYIRVKMGADADGRITAAEAYLAYEAGAFPGSPVNAGCMTVFACYDVPNGLIDGYDVCVNKPRTNAYRAPGATNAAFAVESVIEEICERLGIDSLEFRLKNAAKEGTRRVDGVVFSRIGMWETVKAIQESEHWNDVVAGSPDPPTATTEGLQNRGEMAAASSSAGDLRSAASAGSGDPRTTSAGSGDPRTRVVAGSPDPATAATEGLPKRAEATADLTKPAGDLRSAASAGSGDPRTTSAGSGDPRTTSTTREGRKRGRGIASGFWFNAGLKSVVTAAVNADGKVALVEGSTDIGGTRTSIAMQLAETLGISAEDVTPTVADTDGIGYTDVTGGSRVTYATGWAAYEAALDIQRQMVTRAADLWDVDPSVVRYEDGKVLGPEDRVFGFRELAAKLSKIGEPLIGRGSANPDKPGGAFATHLVDVEVDPETGKVDILRYTAAQDAGTAIHPSYVEGQMQGGAVQGIGWALNEEYFYDDAGVMRNASFLDYRIPTCYDVPMIDTIIVEVPNPGHPYGVRGAGEVPIVPPPAAIAAAIYQAVGVRLNELPMSPPRVLHALLQKRREGGG